MARGAQEFQHKADAWRAYIELCSQRVEIARAFEGVQGTEANGCSILLKAGEKMFCTVHGAVLVEPRRTKGHWTRASQGLSVQIPETKSMRYRVGATRGTYVQGFETPARIDDGVFTVTNQRGVFIGKKATREWQWAMLRGVFHAADAAWTAIAVSNRKWVSGIACDNEDIDHLRFWIDFAVATVNGTRDAFARELEEHLAEQRAIAAGIPADDGFHAEAKELFAASSRRTRGEPEISPDEAAIPRAVLMRVLQELGFPDGIATGEGFAMSEVDELFDGTRLKVFWHGDRETNIPAIAKALRDAGYAARVVRDRGGYPYVSVRSS